MQTFKKPLDSSEESYYLKLSKAVDLDARNTYDDTKGNRLVTYASRCIENEEKGILNKLIYQDLMSQELKKSFKQTFYSTKIK